MSEAPYYWLRKISSHLQELDAIPLFGTTPAFNWEHLSSSLSARLGVQGLSIAEKTRRWCSNEELKEGLGDKTITLPIDLGPLSGRAFWIMSHEGVAKLTSWMMNGHTKARPLSSDVLTEGFYRYLLLQTLDAASTDGSLQRLSILLNDPSPLPETDAFCIDVEIDFNKQSCWGRLVIEPALQRSWREHFSEPQADYIPTKIAQITELTTGIKIGSVQLSSQDCKTLKQGDFIALDTGSYHPRKETGAAYLTVGKTALFQVTVKHNKIQLIDYAFMYEEEMENNKGMQNGFSGHGEAEQFPPAAEESLTLKELPVNVTVELARLRITLEKLIQLVPGNMIELPIQPDQPVHLTVGGQVVGKAELVQLGETLGIRILEIG
jgi:flagellar motor switch protein FliN/FliY